MPSFFLTNNARAPYSETLGLINCFSSNSSNCFFNSPNSDADIRHGVIEIRLVPGTKSIAKSTFLSGGKSVMSFGKTSGNSRITGKLPTSFSLLSFNEANIINTLSSPSKRYLPLSDPTHPKHPAAPSLRSNPPKRTEHQNKYQQYFRTHRIQQENKQQIRTTQQTLKVFSYHSHTNRKNHPILVRIRPTWL